MKNPAIAKRMTELDIVEMGITPEQATAFVASESAKWGKVVKDNNIKLD